MLKKKGLSLSVFAGSFAALASVCAKLVTSPEIEHLAKYLVSSVIIDDNNYLTLVLRGLCVAGVFLCNALMWTFFTKSLQFLSSLHATITNTSSNFLVSAILGKLLFNELLPILWWIGSVFILFGLLLIHKDGHKTQDLTDKKS